MTGTEADFVIQDLQAGVDGKPILNGLNLAVNRGEVHAIMGPNGSGKSTLANVIMGHPGYAVSGGAIRLRGENILEQEPEERARRGIFLAFQYPVAVPGVTVAKFLKTAQDAVRGERKLKPAEFMKELRANMEYLEMNEAFLNRHLNDGFSGGEKKRMEILQMLMLRPQIAVMDETDSGLDIDALRIVSKGVNKLVGPELGLIVITHYERILTYIQPAHLHILMGGRIVTSGGPEMVKELERKGYDWVREKIGEVNGAT